MHHLQCNSDQAQFRTHSKIAFVCFRVPALYIKGNGSTYGDRGEKIGRESKLERKRGREIGKQGEREINKKTYEHINKGKISKRRK